MGKGTSTVTAAAVSVSFATAYSEAGKSKVTYNDTAYNTMQNMTASICSNVTNNQTATLLDNRVATASGDTKRTYTVAKLNGKCWMTKNLRFNATSLATSTSNVSKARTLTHYDLETDGKSSGKCYADISCDADSCSMNGAAGYTYLCIKDNSKGTYYNYAAATAGTIKGEDNENTATEDVCPKGWKMPSISEATGSVFNSTTTYVSSFKATTGVAGYWRKGTFHENDMDYWWTSETNGDIDYWFRTFLSYNYLGEGKLRKDGGWHGREAGYHIRCVAKPN